MARRNPITENDFKMKSFVSEDDLKTELFSVEIQTPKINSNVRDRSCIVTFPRIENTRLTRATVENIMKEQWGDLFNNVISYGNIDFSRRWVFNFDTLENNDRAVAKEVFINGSRIKTTHATRKFNILKIDWVPLWTNLDDLSEIIKKVGGSQGNSLIVDGGEVIEFPRTLPRQYYVFIKTQLRILIHPNMYIFMMSMVPKFFCI